MSWTPPAVTQALAKEHGLSVNEFDKAQALVGRPLTFVELGLFSVMWSEHCSYKSSRVFLSGLPTTGARVILGPGENAGVVDIGDGDAICFKMESHNHPSFIEPFQGAATGVGGILRDVFTMGARPIACLDSLRFGRPEHPRTPALIEGVVAGIAGYGNAFGVPTVGGEVGFDQSYDGNILVNAMAVGLVKKTASSSGAPPASATPSSTSAPRPVATASTARPWRAPNSTTRPRASARPCRWAIPSSRNCSSKPASS